MKRINHMWLVYSKVVDVLVSVSAIAAVADDMVAKLVASHLKTPTPFQNLRTV